MQFHREKKTNKQKSHKSLFESLSKNTWRYMKLKYLDQLRKKTGTVSSWSRSQSPIDNCSLFIRYKVENKSQATSYKYMLCGHSPQQWGVSIASFLVQQNQQTASNNFITSFAWVSEWWPRDISAPKIQIHCDCDGCTSKFFLFSLSASFLAVLLCKILESRWLFKSVHRKSVLIFIHPVRSHVDSFNRRVTCEKRKSLVFSGFF